MKMMMMANKKVVPITAPAMAPSLHKELEQEDKSLMHLPLQHCSVMPHS